MEIDNMSGMHLLPVYYTTTNQKKRRKKKTVTKSMQSAIIEHEKYLRRMGIDPEYKRTPTPLKTERVAKQLPDNVPMSEMDWSQRNGIVFVVFWTRLRN